MIRLSATPYTRPMARLPLSRPWTPVGQLLLPEALERFGKWRFGEEWTGEELSARRDKFGPPQPPSEPEGGELLRVKKADGGVEEINSPVRYVVDGRLVFLPYTEAVRRFEAEKDDLYRLWQEEAKASQRFVKAWYQFRQVLHSGRVSGAVIGKHGITAPIQTYQWAADDTEKMLLTGRTKVAHGDLYTIDTIEGVIIISESELETYFEQSRPEAAADSEASNSAIPDSAPATQSGSSGPAVATGGRPPKWDWEAFWVRLCVMIHNDGVPETQAELVRKLQDWFGKTQGDMPHESEIKKRVSKLFRAFREEGK